MVLLLQKRVAKWILIVLPIAVCSITAQAQKPNIIYIMTDDMGYGDLSGYGRKDYSTPNLDKLASEGIKFVNAYSAAPVCTPTRTAFMTGRYPARTPVGLMEPLVAAKPRDSAFGLTTNYPSVATLVRNAGYETALIGKWHLGFTAATSPNSNGFDYFFGIHSGAADYVSHKSEGTSRTNDLYENDKLISRNGYLTEMIAAKAIEFLKKKHSKPFFLEVAFTAPHWPWQGPGDAPYPDTANYTRGGSPAIYAQMMKSLDAAIGDIVKALSKAKVKNTIVIFTNDNGGEKYSDNGGLSGMKMMVSEGGIRVPAFVRWPGNIVGGSLTNQVAVTMDWTATILSAAGAKASKDFPLDGIDLMPVMTGKASTMPRTIYWRTFQRMKGKAVRDGDWKYIQNDKGEEFLFNLATDNGEKINLKDTNKDIFDRLKQQVADWEKTVLVPVSL
jgi:arylsulfatase A-like enzyme